MTHPPLPWTVRPIPLHAWRWKILARGPRHGALLALLLLIAGNTLFTPNFATAATLWNVLLQIATIGLVATGMTLVIATGGIDLSVGSVMAVTSVLAVTLLPNGVPVAVLAGLGVALAVGLLSGALIAYLEVPPFLVTLALMISGRGAAQLISAGNPLNVVDNSTFEALGRGYLGPVPVPVALLAGVVGAAAFAVRSTCFGRYLVAIGGNGAAARLCGVPIPLTQVAVYALCSLLAGLAGLVETARLAVSDPGNVGVNMEFEAIAAAVMGGTSLRGGRASIVGTVTGALLLAVINVTLNMHLVRFAWSLVFKAALILLAVYIQRQRPMAG